MGTVSVFRLSLLARRALLAAIEEAWPLAITRHDDACHGERQQ